MKIGILTFHRCINYGSYWQARCLADGLRAQGHDAVILDHASRRVALAEWKCAFRPTGDPAHGDRAGYRRKIHRFFRAFEGLPLSPPFPLESAAAHGPAMDVALVGSDEVWNLSHPWYGGQPLFYGDGLRARRLVAYAASFGNHDACDGLDPRWSARLRSFGEIAVRDDHSRALVEASTGTVPEVVLDPCLQFPVEPDPPAEALPEAPCVVVYGHGFSPDFIREVTHWAARRRLPLLSIGYRNDWADRQWLSAGPHEFAHCIAGATAVATNFFHGCVFALRNRKPFACETSWYRANKLRCLMAQVGGERHLVDASSTAADYDSLLGAPPDPDIDARIGRLRTASRRFLDRALAPCA